MKILITENGTEIKVFSSPDEMPISRYNEFQKFMLIESGIGSNAEEVDGHYSRQMAFIANDQKEDSIKEIENTRHSLLSIINGINYTAYTFACQVIEINGVPCDDITEDGLNRTLDLLKKSGISQGEIKFSNEELKKK